MLNKFFFFSKKSSEIVLLQSTLIIWITTKLLSWKLWSTHRLFPVIPMSGFLNTSPSVHNVLFAISILIMVGLLKFHTHQSLLSALLIVEISACLLDINRLQPWEYQFIFVVFIYRFNKPSFFNTVLFMLACIYFYSGLQKLNPAFLQNIWGDLILKRSFHLNSVIIYNKWIYHAGYILALFESLCGFALLIKEVRKYAAYALILFHCLILIFFGPLILNINFIIWPWNILMIICLLIFIKEQENLHFRIFSLIEGWNKLPALCWAILPLLGVFGYWDSYLSSNLYSGKNQKAVILINDTTKTFELKKFYKKSNSKEHSIFYINIMSWSLSELHVPYYPEKRVLNVIEEKLKRRYGDSTLKFIY